VQTRLFISTLITLKQTLQGMSKDEKNILFFDIDMTAEVFYEMLYWFIYQPFCLHDVTNLVGE
jgi:hypothetical protein